MEPVPSSSSVVHSIYRYPVKGLSPEKLERSLLVAGEPIAGDRMYAIENGPSGFDAKTPIHLPKTRFLNLMRNERLAALKTVFDEASHLLTVQFDGNEVARGNLQKAEGRAAIEEFVMRYFSEDLRGRSRIVSAPGHSFSDVGLKVVSVINLASISEIEKAVGGTVDPLRFRANIYVEGWPPWHEFDLMGREIGIQSARIKVVARIDRCTATDVDPATGIRNLNVPKTLMRAFGTVDCGVYAVVTAAGEIATGDLTETLPQ
jgi:uncharacterized protein YcbX